MTSAIATGELAPEAVRAMFDRIAPIYDRMNRLMTAGLDRSWREATARQVVRLGDTVLDAACGTGDLALADLCAGAARVVGVDFSERMLERARRKSSAVEWVRGDLCRLPFPDRTFQAVTIGFGLRNVPEPQSTLTELRRVLAPGGRVGILEITRPRGVLVPFFRIWFDALVPLAGKLLRGGSAYSYLPASVRRFPTPEELASQMAGAGFEQVRYRLLAGGIVTLHVGVAS
jgi:demethylmenaquinone methyltransferase/2-methoxy-6-polyprenyl-1,4-benzoquinol methylase